MDYAKEALEAEQRADGTFVEVHSITPKKGKTVDPRPDLNLSPLLPVFSFLTFVFKFPRTSCLPSTLG